MKVNIRNILSSSLLMICQDMEDCQVESSDRNTPIVNKATEMIYTASGYLVDIGIQVGTYLYHISSL